MKEDLFGFGVKGKLVVLCWVLLSVLFPGNGWAENEIKLSIQSGHAATVNDVKFNSENNLVGSVGDDNRIVLWHIKSGKELNVFVGHEDQVNELDFHPTKPEMVSVDESGTFKIWNYETGKCLQTVSEIPYAARSVAYSHDGNTIYIGSRVIYKYDVPTKKLDKFDIFSKGYFDAIKVDRNGKYLAFGGNKESNARILRLEDNAIIGSFLLSANQFDFDSAGTTLYGADDQGRLRYYDIDLKRAAHVKGANSRALLESFNGVAVNDKYVFASASDLINVYSAKTFRLVKVLKAHLGEVTKLDMSSDGKYLVSSGKDKNLVIWDAKRLDLSKTFVGNSNQINAMEFTEDGTSIFLAYDDGMIRKWNLNNNFIKTNKVVPTAINSNAGWEFSIRDIKKVYNDSTVLFQVHKRKKSFVNNNIFTKFHHYNLDWNSTTDKIEMTENTQKDPRVSEYIQSLKQTKIHNKLGILDVRENLKDRKNGWVVLVDTLGNMRINGKGLNHQINTDHLDKVTCVRINPKYDFVATASWDGLIKLWDLKTGEHMVSMGIFGLKDYIYVNKDNYYYASKGSLKYVGFRIGTKAFTFEQFDLKYNRPDIVFAPLPFFDKKVLKNYEKAYKKRLSKMNITEDELLEDFDIPVMSVALPEQLDIKVRDFSFKVEATDEKQDLNKLFVKVNGVPEYGKLGKDISGRSFSDSIHLTLNPGLNKIDVYVTNKKNKSSFRESFKVLCKVKLKKPDLYLVTIGASHFKDKQYDLTYAQKDASDIVSKLTGSKNYNEIFTKALLNEQVTKENISNLKDFLKGADENDVVVMFAAGHGVLDHNFDYFFATHDMDFVDPGKRGLPYDTFDKLLDNTRSRKKVMFLDACHSGEIDKDEVEVSKDEEESSADVVFRNVGVSIQNRNAEEMNSFEMSKILFADMRDNNGSTVVSSASGGEFAMEGEQWNNGVFTYCLLNGLNTKKADINKDGKIMLSELQEYLLLEVSDITNGMQHPTSRLENLSNDFRIW